MVSRSAPVATPLPTSPTRGEVPAGYGTIVPQPFFTSPLVGEAGRGVARHPVAEARHG